MSESNSDQYVRVTPRQIEPAGAGVGYLLIGGMALALVALDVYGFRQATNLPPLIGITLALLVCVVRFYMLRRRPSHERISYSGLERAAACTPASILAIAMAAFAIYGFAVWGTDGTEGLRGPRMSNEQLETATAAIEDYYRLLRTTVGTRNNLNERRLSQLKSEAPDPERQAEIESLEREQRQVRKLLRLAAAGVRPTNPAPPDEASPPVERELLEDENALRKRYEEAARLHQQLPDFIRDEVALPTMEALPVEKIRGGKLEQFLRDTLSLTNQAIGCWAVPAILEFFIIILMLVNRPRD